MAIPDTPTLRVILLKSGLELDGRGMRVGAILTLERMQAISLLRNGVAEIVAPEQPTTTHLEPQP